LRALRGLRYFDIINEKLKERGAAYKALYAFSDFTHPATNAAISEHAVNALKDGELIEQRFEGADPVIRSTVTDHRDDGIYLQGAYRGQVNGQIQAAYSERGRYEELSDSKYTDVGCIFDIMAYTVIQQHLSYAV
jgi:hypothetical protein